MTGGDHIAGEQTIEKLMDALGRAFDLRLATSAGVLGEAVRDRLSRLDISDRPQWGTSGSISQVAKHESDALDFYYRPHLFPDMSSELRLAHHLQFDLLPRELPSSAPLEIAAVLESYCHLSGDMLGWRRDGDGLLLWIADVSGHGVRAGLAAAVLHFLIQGAEPGLEPVELVARLNRQMFEARNPADRLALFVTLFLARFEPSGSGCYASAGHPPMLVRHADGALERLPGQGPPVGLFPDARFLDDSFDLEPDDVMFLFTDGLLEAGVSQEREFGMERIEQVVRPPFERPLELSKRVYRTVLEHKGSTLLDDDLTFLAARPMVR